MTIPRGRIVTLSLYQPRQMLPVSIHRGDVVDITVNWVRLLRAGETPNEVLNAASVAGQGVSITNVEFSGKYLTFTISGAQSTGEARISMAVSTSNGRTLSRSLMVRTVWEDAVIDAVLPDPGPACQLFELFAAMEDNRDEGTFLLPDAEVSETRAAYGVAPYTSSHFTIDNDQVYDAQLLYMGAEFGELDAVDAQVFGLILAGELAQDYFDHVYMPDGYDGAREQPFLTSEADGFGVDGNGNTYWYWVIEIACYFPWTEAGTVNISIDCDEPIDGTPEG